MIKRYENNYGDMMEDADGYFVKYEDYLALHALMCGLTDQINLCELPEGLYNELEFAGVL